MSDKKFEAHIKSTAWYGVLSQAAKDGDEGASVFRMARMAAREAWNASRVAVIEEAAKVCDQMVSVSAISYETGSACATAIRALANQKQAG